MKEPIVKIEPEEYEVIEEEYKNEIRHDVLFLKSESIENDPEQEYYFSEPTKPVPKKIKLSKSSTEDIKKTHKCEICSLTFGHKKDLIDHINSIHAYPDDEMGSKSKKTLHSKDEMIKPMECDICREIFNDKEQLIEHFKAHFDKDTVLNCSECNKSFNGLFKLTFHKNLDHNSKFWCICYRTFDNRVDMQKCRKIHKITLENENWCNECKSYVGYDTLLKLARHKNNAHGNGIRFWCVGCCKVYFSEEESMKCKDSHNSSKIKCDVQCPDCGKKVKYYTFKMHHLTAHSDKRDMMCDQCAKGFSTQSQLTCHINNFHNKSTYVCDLCPFKSSLKHYLKVHINQNHNQENITNALQCPICLKKLFTSIDAHLKKSHPNNYDNGARADPQTNNYHCSNCIQSFTSLNHYERHVKGKICSDFGKCEVDQNQKVTIFTKGK